MIQINQIVTVLFTAFQLAFYATVPFLLVAIIHAIKDQTKWMKSEEELNNIGDN